MGQTDPLRNVPVVHAHHLTARQGEAGEGAEAAGVDLSLGPPVHSTSLRLSPSSSSPSSSPCSFSPLSRSSLKFSSSRSKLKGGAQRIHQEKSPPRQPAEGAGRSVNSWREEGGGEEGNLVRGWLEELGLSGCAAAFEGQKIDCEALALLNDSSLSLLGVVALGDRVKLRQRAQERLLAARPGTGLADDKEDMERRRQEVEEHEEHEKYDEEELPLQEKISPRNFATSRKKHVAAAGRVLAKKDVNIVTGGGKDGRQRPRSGMKKESAPPSSTRPPPPPSSTRPPPPPSSTRPPPPPSSTRPPPPPPSRSGNKGHKSIEDLLREHNKQFKPKAVYEPMKVRRRTEISTLPPSLSVSLSLPPPFVSVCLFFPSFVSVSSFPPL
eukprot:763935-Hanusia_phi.AAC.1